MNVDHEWCEDVGRCVCCWHWCPNCGLCKCQAKNFKEPKCSERKRTEAARV